jgi:nucleoside-diphosphate-sugar epimerase
MAKILSVGCGDIGGELNQRLVNAGHQVTGLKRHPPPVADKITYIAANIALPLQLQSLGTDFDFVFFILSPDSNAQTSYQTIYETGVNNLLAHFSYANQSPRWFFISSTSVYGQSQGEWVNEDSLAEPSNLNSQFIRAAERKIMAANPENIVVRFSGIYGKGREYLLNRVQQTPEIQKNPPYFTNRIHQHDCVEVLLFLLQQRLNGKNLEQCYLASDDNPAPTWEVISWLASQMNCPQPNVKINNIKEMNKRCNNQRLKALGYRFYYPSYKEGYLPLVLG